MKTAEHGRIQRSACPLERQLGCKHACSASRVIDDPPHRLARKARQLGVGARARDGGAGAVDVGDIRVPRGEARQRRSARVAKQVEHLQAGWGVRWHRVARRARAARGVVGCARGRVAARPRRRSGASANSCPAPERPQLVHSDPAIARARSQPPTPCTTAHRVGWRAHLPMRHRPRAGGRYRRCPSGSPAGLAATAPTDRAAAQPGRRTIRAGTRRRCRAGGSSCIAQACSELTFCRKTSGLPPTGWFDSAWIRPAPAGYALRFSAPTPSSTTLGA